MKTMLKKAVAYIIMQAGVLFFVLGEPVLVNHYYIERIVVSFVLFSVGARYWWILQRRLEKYGRC